MIGNQDEYDVILEIPDYSVEEYNICAKINAKIQFIWSYYKFYNEKLLKTEENIYNLQLALQKKRAVLTHLEGNIIIIF